MKLSFKIFSRLCLIAVMAGLASPSYAIEFNLFKVDNSTNNPSSGLVPTGTPQEANIFAKMLGDGFGFPQNQMAPAMLGPAHEVPTITRIAQAAGTVPMTVWMFRRMGMSYTKILSVLALSPNTLDTPGYGPINNYDDNVFISLGQRYFLQNILGVQPQHVSQFPFGSHTFIERILRPYDSIHENYWMPPGIAKKYGLWMPPGQAKKFYGHPNLWKANGPGWKGYPGHGKEVGGHSFHKAKGHGGHGKHKVEKHKSHHGHKNHHVSSKGYPHSKSKGNLSKGNGKGGGKGK